MGFDEPRFFAPGRVVSGDSEVIIDVPLLDKGTHFLVESFHSHRQFVMYLHEIPNFTFHP